VVEADTVIAFALESELLMTVVAAGSIPGYRGSPEALISSAEPLPNDADLLPCVKLAPSSVEVTFTGAEASASGEGGFASGIADATLPAGDDKAAGSVDAADPSEADVFELVSADLLHPATRRAAEINAASTKDACFIHEALPGKRAHRLPRSQVVIQAERVAATSAISVDGASPRTSSLASAITAAADARAPRSATRRP
jgi:hypothetical protein